ncbi:homeobox-leucine zipper protein HOX3-like [Humulus lupulus]|uniref:homeobox-leucine zipper protein HOX3-like n=1 Tax=Humulus lupulus TaxID=3486 RepID=UPI002B411712|nr:homeobox-leucine zipper protein HOX3-like [Humulus lupulus]
MAILPTTPSSLELTIGFSSSPSLSSSVMRDLDINQVPSVGRDHHHHHDHHDHDHNNQEDSMEDEDEMMMSSTTHSGPPRKKLRLTKEQSRLLEESFRQHHTLNPKQKEALALQLKLRPRQVEVWFQNRRARSKLKQTEMECEYLKRWFGSLTEQNRRLQREVEELRSMKVGPPTVISPHSCEPLPASTLTMCPRCERVTTSTTSAVAGNHNMPGPTRTGAASTAVALSSKVTTPSL